MLTGNVMQDDFKRMADYGLNTVRIPIPYWVYNVTEDEPYITQKQIPYIQQALNWSSLYGMDVMMDLHALPGKLLRTVFRVVATTPISPFVFRLAI
jgi:aryl-phospho-beta-D-glucosidase BglC (GH1 family)